VEGALDAAADHLAAVSDVCAQVPAVPGEQMQLTGFAAVGDKVLAKISKRPHLALPKLG
jgi:hypothetical protein